MMLTVQEQHAKDVRDRLNRPDPKQSIRQRLAAIEPETVAFKASTRFGTIIREIEAKHGITLEKIMGRSRVKDICEARHELWYRLRHDAGMSEQGIADKTGGFDSTTVHSGIHAHRLRALLASSLAIQKRPKAPYAGAP